MIDSFQGQYRFLSNFWPVEVVLDGVAYPSVEHAYQAAKTHNEQQRHEIRNAKTPGDAKRLGRRVDKRPDWDDVKLATMSRLLVQKFAHSALRAKLDATNGESLIEGNTCGDTFWGVCRGVGENHLGKLLMQIRSNDSRY